MRYRSATSILTVACAGACLVAQTDRPSRSKRLAAVRAWASQLQGIAGEASRQRLVAARVDLLVIEPTNTVKGSELFDTRVLVRRIQASRGPKLRHKLCLAYLNIGQAEDYRSYWRTDWRAPVQHKHGKPDFLVAVDPDGWAGNYPVAFWRRAWRDIVFGSPSALLDRAMTAGFDGVYLDWVLGFAEPAVVKAARSEHVDPARAMVDLVRDLRRYARRKRPGFLVIVQNGAPLAAVRPELARAVDGFAQEDLSFRGTATDDWNDPEAGDIPVEPAQDLATQLVALKRRGLPVLTIDYARRPANVRAARARSLALGTVPFVSLTPLDRLPERVLPARGRAKRR